jgi:hypothetical protein
VHRTSLQITHLLILPILATTLAVFPLPADATKRNRSARAEFQHLNPCPATGKPRGPCPGYVVDHVKPLCAGGADLPANLQWQTVPAAKLKDKLEARECRALRSGSAP